MCGIIGYTGSNAVPYLIKGLELLEYRGYDSAGIAVNGKNGIECIKKAGRVSALKCEIDSLSYSDTGIGHTRWATHGKPDNINAHPHFSQTGLFAIVHNGIIENYPLLRKQLENDGFSFLSDTDSEVIAHLLEKNYSGDVISALGETAAELQGTFALGILCREAPDSIYFAARESPLTVAVTPCGSFISSDSSVLAAYTDRAYRLKNGEIGRLTKTGAEIYKADGSIGEYSPVSLYVSEFDTDKGEFEHYMLKEIFQQPQAVHQTCQAYVREGEAFAEGFPFDEKTVKKISHIYLTGCGSAYHVCLTGKYIIEKLTGIPCQAEIASELRYACVPLDSSTPVILISQSGETADTLAALRLAKEKGAPTVSVINVRNSTMAAESDFCFFTLAGREIAVATTKAYSAQLVVMYLFTLRLAQLCENITQAEYGIILESILSLPDRIRSAAHVLQGQIIGIAKVLQYEKSLFFIGRNLDYPAAMESALKLTEVSYIHCTPIAAGELKHGSISLIEKGSTVFALCCNPDTFYKTLSNVREVISRGARVICITDSAHKKACEAFGTVITLPVSHPITAPSLEIIPMQLLSYYTALLRGCDIDKPRNLAKSVTVE